MKAVWPAVLLGCMLLQPTVSPAESQSERILNFDSQINVRASGTLQVVETIQVNAAGQHIQHGIYRDFPQLYRDRLGLHIKTGFTVQRVRRDGRPEDYHLAKRENGVRVYLGSAATLVSPGVHTYELTYTTDRQLGFFPDHDELYWNVTGNGWIFPIETVTASVTLPAAAQATNLTAYTGVQGARGRDYTATSHANTARFTTTRRLPRENGLTIVVAWQKGIVHPPTATAKLTNTIKDNRGVMLATAGLIIAFIYYLTVWNFAGRDPRRGVIIPRYVPPDGFTPAAVRYLQRMGFDNKAFTASILNLAVQGELKIVQAKEGLFRKKVYTLVPMQSTGTTLSPAEAIVRWELFKDELPLALRKDNYVVLQSAQTGLKDFLAENVGGEFFNRHSWFSVLGLLLCVASLATLLLDSTILRQPAICIFLAILAIGLVIVFQYLLKAYTPAGREVLDQIEGFKMYLSVAEKDRLNLENPPERTPQLFEMFLPYALALGVEQNWTEQFTDVLAAASQLPGQAAYVPVWYQGGSWEKFRSDLVYRHPVQFAGGRHLFSRYRPGDQALAEMAAEVVAEVVAVRLGAEAVGVVVAVGDMPAAV